MNIIFLFLIFSKWNHVSCGRSVGVVPFRTKGHRVCLIMFLVGKLTGKRETHQHNARWCSCWLTEIVKLNPESTTVLTELLWHMLKSQNCSAKPSHNKIHVAQISWLADEVRSQILLFIETVLCSITCTTVKTLALVIMWKYWKRTMLCEQ